MALPWDTAWGDIKWLKTHQGFLTNPRRLSSTALLELGTVISFIYQTEGTATSIPRLVFVIQPSWERKCHGLTLKNISRDELLGEVYPYVQAGITDPNAFYQEIYKASRLYHTDAYRTYFLEKMKSITAFDYNIPDESPLEAKIDKAIQKKLDSDPEFMQAYDKALQKKMEK